MAHPLHTHQTDRPITDNARRRRTLAALALAVGAGYLALRLSSFGSGLTAILSAVLFFTEFWALTELALLSFIAWSKQDATPTALRPTPHPFGPTDVIVIAEGASLDLVERSLIGTAALLDRGTVTVVDGVLRPEIADTASRFLASYVVDARLASGHAARLKSHGQSELLLWLRAGQVPMPGLLPAVVPRFEDPSLAVCQSAVEPLNASSLVHLRGGRDNEALVRRVTGPGRDRFGVSPWRGAASIVRRTALAEMDWAAVSGPSEVGRAQVQLLRNGWRFGYDGRGLIKEAAAESLAQYLDRRRHRAIKEWSLLFSANSPLRAAGLSVRQRFLLLADLEPHVRGLRYVMQTSLLVFALITGRLPVETLSTPLVIGWLATFGLGMTARRSLADGSMALGDWVRHGWRTVEADLHALGDVVLHGGSPWETRSGLGGGLSELGRLWFLTAAVVVLDVALLVRGLSLVNVPIVPTMDGLEQVLVISVALGLLIPMVDVLQFVVGGRQRRSQFRLATTRVITVLGVDTETIDLSPAGVAVRLDHGPAVGTTSPFTLRLPTLDGIPRDVTGVATVRAVTEQDDGSKRVGLEFQALGREARLAIMAYCVLARDGASNRGTPVLSTPDHLPVERSGGHHRSLQGATALAVAAGVSVLMQGTVSATGLLDGVPAQRVCVTHSSGTPAADIAVARLGEDGWENTGTTGVDGCLDVIGSGATYGAARSGDFVDGTADAEGLVSIRFAPREVTVLDRSGAAVPMVVRHHAEAWSEAPVQTTDGWRVESDDAPTHIEISVGEFREVIEYVDADVTVRLSTLTADEGREISEIRSAAGWVPFAEGSELLPGWFAIRMRDGEVVKIEIPDGVEISVPSGALQPLS